jgi:hypothetical protein
MQEIKKLSQEIRDDVQEYNNNKKTKFYLLYIVHEVKHLKITTLIQITLIS